MRGFFVVCWKEDAFMIVVGNRNDINIITLIKILPRIFGLNIK